PSPAPGSAFRARRPAYVFLSRRFLLLSGTEVSLRLHLNVIGIGRGHLGQADDGGIEQHLGCAAPAAGDARLARQELGVKALELERGQRGRQGVDHGRDRRAHDILAARGTAGMPGDMEGAAVVPPARKNHNHASSFSPARGICCSAAVSGPPWRAPRRWLSGAWAADSIPAWAATRFLTVSRPSKSIIPSAMSAWDARSGRKNPRRYSSFACSLRLIWENGLAFCARTSISNAARRSPRARPPSVTNIGLPSSPVMRTARLSS